MKIAHLSDLHYCPKYLTEVDRCTKFALDAAISEGCEIIAITGDETDHHLDAHSPAFLALAKRLRDAADHAPVIVLQGTFSHDVPGTVSLFRLLGGKYPIHVSDRIEQVAWDGENWISSEYYRFDVIPPGTRALFSSLPAVNRADIAVRVGCENAAVSTGELVAELLRGFGPINEAARAQGIPTIALSHGTVAGSLTEHGVPMAGLDHEFTTGALFGAKSSAFMIGHIHAHQTWTENGRQIAYAGSIGRLHYGEKGEKGWVRWDVSANTATLQLQATPARLMREFDYPGLPDMAELTAAGDVSDGAFVRIRYSVDEEHRQAVNRKEIEAAFANAADLKIEARVNPILRSRSTGITRLNSIADQVGVWARATNSPEAGLSERIAQLCQLSPEEILDQLINPPQADKLKEAA